MDEPLSIAREWDALLPDLRAALAVALFVILLEIISDAIPLFGWLVSLPFSVAVYLAQGVITGAFARRDERYVHSGPLRSLGLGARSAAWTGLLSLFVAVLTLLVMTPLSLGAVLVGLPAVLISFVVDLGVNVLFSALGAWVYALAGGKGAVGVSCLLSAGLFACLWLGAAGLVVAAILSALGVLPHPVIH